VDLSRFTMDAYLRIVTYKTAFYTFYLPVACGMVLAGKAQPEALKLANDICIEMGRYFQVRWRLGGLGGLWGCGGGVCGGAVAGGGVWGAAVAVPQWLPCRVAAAQPSRPLVPPCR
jgi:hypothetical protein